MKGTVHIEVGSFEAKVHSPFEAREAIKSLPRRWRSWDANEKCWVIPLHAVDELKRALHAEGFTVRTTHGANGHRQQHTPPPRSPRSKATTWADAMYVALGPELGDKAHKALVPVLHPDRGGDSEAMKQLNAARDQSRRLRSTG